MFMFRKRATLNSGRANGKHRKEIKNVIIFGETGVGKSSLINLIAGQKVSATSSSAVGCTPNYQSYALQLGDQRFAIWDTAGLDEGTQGTVPAEHAEAYLKRLLHDLSKTSGIDLLIYCVRGTRVRTALLANYHLFYSAICRKKVPIAIVITGLENEEDSMDKWWLKNERQFSALQMRFDNYACVTTLQSSLVNPTLEERRRISKDALIQMITSTCRSEPWMPAERNWTDTALPDIRAILSPREGKNAKAANVIMCDVSRPVAPVDRGVIKRSVTFQSPVTLSLSFARLVSFRSPVSAGRASRDKLPFDVSLKRTPERSFRVYQVPRKQMKDGAEEDETKKAMIVQRGADLLIFCVEKKTGGCRDVKQQWEHFNLTYGGDLSPQIVVIFGAADQQSAVEWWNDAVLGGAVTRPGDASIAYWPMSESSSEDEKARGRLCDLINTRCIDCSKANFTGNKQLFGRFTSPRADKKVMSSGSRTGSRRKNTNIVDPEVDHDVLTKLGVWKHMETERVARLTGLDAMSRPIITFGPDDQEQKGPSVTL